MEINDYVSVNHLMAEILVNVNDRELKKGMSKGWYTSRIFDALQELAFDTFYQIMTRDFNFPTDTLALAMPKNAFNLREIYLFNSDCCLPGDSVIVHWKRLYNNRGKGAFHTAKRRETGDGTADTSIDPFFARRSRMRTRRVGGSSLYYANIQNGLIMFSSDCQSFGKVRLVFNGIGGEIGDEPIVPRFFERAVVDYVEERFYNVKKAEQPRLFRVLWADAFQRLNDIRTGSWRKARMRISSMDTYERESLDEYIGNILVK